MKKAGSSACIGTVPEREDAQIDHCFDSGFDYPSLNCLTLIQLVVDVMRSSCLKMAAVDLGENCTYFDVGVVSVVMSFGTVDYCPGGRVFAVFVECLRLVTSFEVALDS
jgi:hypothetical protein